MPPSLPPFPQAYNGHCEALRVLSETLVNLDVRDAAGRTALYLAAERGHTDCVEVLACHGASCVLKERHHKWTPLHVAGTPPPTRESAPGARGCRCTKITTKCQ